LEIKLLHNRDIDENRWNKTVLDSVQFNFSGCSWYLDMLDPDWQGIVDSDYTYVFPILSKTNLQNKYKLYFLWSLYSSKEVTQELFKLFAYKMKQITGMFPVNVNNLNYFKSDLFTPDGEGFKIDMLSDNKNAFYYNRKVNTTIKELIDFKYVVFEGVRNTEAVEYFCVFDNFKRSKSKKDFLKRLLSYCEYHRIGNVLTVLNPNNSVVAISVFVRTNSKAWMYLVSFDKGIDKRGCLLLMIDFYIKKFAHLNIPLEICNSKNIEPFLEEMGFMKYIKYCVNN